MRALVNCAFSFPLYVVESQAAILTLGVMDRYHEKFSNFFTRLAYGLGGKRRSTVSRSPAPQTSLSTSPHISSSDRVLIVFAVFQLPDELILSVLSHIYPRYSNRYSQFRIHEKMGIDHYRKMRVRFLQPLSMTCRAMRLRLIPWIWEYLQVPPPRDWSSRGEIVVRELNAIANFLCADTFPAFSVKYFRAVLCPWACADSRPLEVHDSRPRGERFHFSSVRQMPTVPPKSTHAGNRTSGLL